MPSFIQWFQYPTLQEPVAPPPRDVAFPSGSWSQPPPSRRLIQYQAWTAPVFLGEAITSDKWFSPFSDPVRIKPRLNAALQQFLAYSESAQFPETVTESRWHYPWSEPVRQKRGLGLWLQQTEAAIHGETPVSFAYYNWLSEPVRFKQGLRASLQQFYTADTVPFTALSNPVWFAPFSEPVRIPRRVIWHQPFATDYTIPNPSTLLEGWYNWLSEPRRYKRGVIAGNQQAFTFGPVSYITAVLAALETKDVFAGTLYEASSLTGAVVSIVEISPIYANTSTSYPATVFANVSIIEIEV